MKHKLKALASLCLALALTLCLALPAWAVGGDDAAGRSITQETKGSITVSEVESGVTVNVYRLMHVNVDAASGQPKMPVYSWVKPVGDWLKGNETYKEYISSDGNDYSVTDNFTLPENDVDGTKAAEIAAFYDSLAAAIRDNTITGLTTEEVEAEGTPGQTTSCTIPELPMGNYLVLIEGGMKIYRPSAVNLVPEWKPGTGDNPGEWVISSPAEVAIKSSALIITKKVKDTATYSASDNVPELDYAQVDIGDTVTYILEADVPQFPADAINKGYVISDNLPAGMTLNASTVKVYGIGEDSQETEIAATGYSVTSQGATRPEGVTEDKETKNVDFSITFDNIVDIHKNYSKIKITYTATANKDIKVVGDSEGEDTNITGNQNTAYLDYNNNPYEKADDTTPLSWQTAKATATVYTYGIKVTKTDDKKPGELLAGAEFQVYKDEDENGVIDDGESAIQFASTGSGTYRVEASDDVNKTDKVTTIEVASADTPNLTLSGLDVGTYILKETKAPAGYNLPSHTFSVTITDEKNTSGTTDAERATPNGKPEYTPSENGTTKTDRADGYQRTTITNTQGFTLPTTGGMGTVLFTAGGVVLMGAGLVLLVVFLRRRRAK